MGSYGNQNALGNRGGGMISSFDPEKHLSTALAAAKMGMTDKQLAMLFDVSVGTIHNWKKKNPEFLEALNEGKLIADAKVVRSLYERATGYSHPEEKLFQFDGEVIRADTTKHYAPDPISAIFWLKNRRPGEWRDRVEHTGADGERLGQLTQNVLMIQVDPAEAAKVYTDLMSHAPRALPAPSKNVTDVEEEIDPADEFL